VDHPDVPDMRKGASDKGALGNNRIAVIEQNYRSESTETLQQKKLSRRFGFLPDTASTVAELAFIAGVSR
jgi:hypothetical protein